MVKLVFVDMDDTFVAPDKTIPADNLRILDVAHERGVQFVPCTGRSLRGLPQQLISHPCVRYAVCANGAIVSEVATGRTLREVTIRKDLALDLYRHAVRIDFGDDPTSSDAGIHSANMGNIWQCAVCGFAGLHWDDGELSLENHLPASWRELSFELAWHGARLRVTLTPEGFEVTHLSGAPVTLSLDGVRTRVAPGGGASGGERA